MGHKLFHVQEKLIDDSSQSHKSLKSNIRMFRERYKQIKVLFRNTYET